MVSALGYHPALSSRDVVDSVNSLLDMQLDLFAPTKEVMDAAVDLAFDEGITVCDAAYVALAEFLGSKIVTGDEKLFERLSEGRRRSVLLIKNYK